MAVGALGTISRGGTRTTSLPSNYKSMSVSELQSLKQNLSSTGALMAYGKPTLMAQELDRTIAAAQNKSEASSGAASASSVPQSVAEPFERALATLSGADSDAERLYQQGRRTALSQGAISAINAGAANTVNMPAMGIAYDQANRPGFNVGVAAQKAGVLQNLGSTAANIYGVNVGAETSRYATDVGAATASSGQALQFASNQANQALQQYIAQLNAQPTLSMSNAAQPSMLRSPA